MTKCTRIPKNKDTVPRTKRKTNFIREKSVFFGKAHKLFLFSRAGGTHQKHEREGTGSDPRKEKKFAFSPPEMM